jgi:MFS family permease
MFGAFTAFMPLFALILPQKIATLPDIGGSGAVQTLSWILVAGGVAAGSGNIVAGVVSDALFRRTQSRRLLITVGAFTVAAGLAALGLADSFAKVVLAIVAYQLALNLMLSPLVALLVDYVPDSKKGRMAGWLGLALPFGSLMVTVLTMAAPLTPGTSPTEALTITIIVVLVLVAPLIIFWPIPPLIAPQSEIETAPQAQRRWIVHDFILAWTARLLVQFAAAAICPYLYFYVADVVRPAGGVRAIGSAIGVLAFAFAVMSVAGALYVGWVSDRLGRRRAPLAIAAIVVAASIAILSVAPGWPLTVAAYGGLAAGLAGFLAIDSALVAQLVAANPRRATLLGVMNLTNTLPGILAPALTLVVIGEWGEALPMVLVMQVAAGGALIAALCGSRLRTLR